MRRNKFAVSAGVLLLLFVLGALLAPYLAPNDPYAVTPSRKLELPSLDHWLGTDELGRDVLSRLLYGGRVSLTLGFVATSIGLGVGVLVGLAAGYFRALDNVLMRGVDVLMAVPTVLLAIALVAVLGPGLHKVMLAVGVGTIPAFARLTRSAVLTLREVEFVQASRAAGASDWFILSRHIFRNVLPPILVYGSLHMANSLLAASVVSFLGLGVQPPTAEWGAMVSGGRAYLRQAPLLSTIPSMAIFLVAMSLNLLGDTLRDRLDPRLRGTL